MLLCQPFSYLFSHFSSFLLFDFHECSWLGVENPCLVWAPDCLDCVISIWLGLLACAQQICISHLSGLIETDVNMILMA